MSNEDSVTFAQRLRRLMSIPVTAESLATMQAGIQEIFNERITELNERRQRAREESNGSTDGSTDGTTVGPKPEP